MPKKTFLTITVFLIANLLLVSCVSASSEMWSQTYGGPEYDVASSLVETSDGGYAIGGQKSGDFWLAKTDDYGSIPEFPTWAIVPLLFVMFFAAILCKHKFRLKMNNN